MCTLSEKDEIVDFVSQVTGSSSYKVLQIMQRAALLLDNKLRKGEVLRIPRKKFVEAIGATLCLEQQLPSSAVVVVQKVIENNS